MNLSTATQPQQDAILANDPDITVIAGPGSGKTATLVARIERLLLEGHNPATFCVVTFTNAGARELERRLAATMEAQGLSEEGDPPLLGFVGTLHALALRMLREHGGPYGYGSRLALISPEASMDLLLTKARSMGYKDSIEGLVEYKRAMTIGAGPKKTKSHFDLKQTICATWYAEMRAAAVVDYDMILVEFERLMSDPECDFREKIAKLFRFLLADEIQDSAPIDWRIYKLFPAPSKFYVGDPDQAIYGFRGGRVWELLAHTKEGTRVICLEANFRSRAAICETAQRLIVNNVGRVRKATTSLVPGLGHVHYVAFPSEVEEMAAVCQSIRRHLADRPAMEIAVLAYTNEVVHTYRRALAAAGLPVVKASRTEIPPDWRLARAFVELIADPENDATAFFFLIARQLAAGKTEQQARDTAHAVRLRAAAEGRSINAHAIDFKQVKSPAVALEALGSLVSRESRDMAAERLRHAGRGATVHDLALAMAEVYDAPREEGDGVRVLTMHGAKGREFDLVFIVAFEDELIPGWDADEVEGMEEKRRLAYVAITRARESLMISSAAVRATKWKAQNLRTPSRFVAEMGLSATC